jgi:hypothetical protein
LQHCSTTPATDVPELVFAFVHLLSELARNREREGFGDSNGGRWDRLSARLRPTAWCHSIEPCTSVACSSVAVASPAPVRRSVQLLVVVCTGGCAAPSFTRSTLFLALIHRLTAMPFLTAATITTIRNWACSGDVASAAGLLTCPEGRKRRNGLLLTLNRRTHISVFVKYIHNNSR